MTPATAPAAPEPVMTEAQAAVIKVLDSQIASIDTKLAPFHGLMMDRDRLKAARATLLSQGRTPRAKASGENVGPGKRITVDQIEEVFEAFGNKPMSAQEVADELDVSSAAIRSQFSRYHGTKFAKSGDKWVKNL